MGSVLITDSLLRKSLASVRSLGKRGVKVYCSEISRLTPSSFSRYCTKAMKSPDPVEEPDSYMDWLFDVLRKFNISVYLPMDDATMKLAVMHQKELLSQTAFLLPPLQSFALAMDKYKAVGFASSAGLDVPRTYMPDSLDRIESFAQDLPYPAVIKPRLSSGSRGIRIVHNPKEMVAQYRQIHARYPFPMVQEYILPGERIDVCLLFNAKGELKLHFVQREVRHFPVDIGPSTVQESVWMPELVERILQTMKHLPWSGVIEVELMRDGRDGKLKLMEMNPRFWNSLHLAIRSGVDFPWGYYLLAQDKEMEQGETYLIGKMAKNMLPGDLLHFITNPKRFQMDPPLLGRKGFYDIEDDILSWHDPLPTFGFFAASFAYLLKKKKREMLLKR